MVSGKVHATSWIATPLLRKISALFRPRQLLRWTFFLAVVVIGVFLLLRLLPPPTSALMVFRRVQAALAPSPQVVGAPLWKWVPLTEISSAAQRAVIVAEDSRFLRHWGVDLNSLYSVLSREGRRSRKLRGASTITMQTVKNLFLWPGRSYVRKGLEMLASPLFDFVVGKRRTLELYLNIVEWGPGIYGVESASLRYFGKRAKYLNAIEAGALAAVLPSPLTTSPKSLSMVARRRLYRILRDAPQLQLPRW